MDRPDYHEPQLRTLKRICVFCGSRAGRDDRYRDAAIELGELLVESGRGLVFGGGRVGLMGVIADAVLETGGEVIGVLPHMLATRELRHSGVADMRLVDDMHARKALMAELSDAFVALPGGYGTLEEFFEVVTWSQLGIHAKTVGLLNSGGFFDPLVAMIERAVSEGFIRPRHRELIVVADNPRELLERLQAHRPPRVRKWLGPSEM